MAQDKFIASFVFLALIFCLGFFSIEGRLLKSDEGVRDYLFNGKSDQKETVNVEKHEDDIVHGGVTRNVPITLASVSLSTPPSAAVTVTPPPPVPGHGVDVFRPTTPGHSPGVGHFVNN